MQGLAGGGVVAAGVSGVHGWRNLSGKTPLDVGKGAIKNLEGMAKEGGVLHKLFGSSVESANLLSQLKGENVENILRAVAEKHEISKDHIDAVMGEVSKFRNGIDNPHAEKLGEIQEKLHGLTQNPEALIGDLRKATTEELVKATKKTEADIAKVFETSVADIEKLFEAGNTDLKKAGRAVLTEAENAGRKAMGVMKYERANMWEKPFVAFESMSTKGKCGLGAVVAASALGIAMLSNRMGKSHADQIADRRAASPEGVALSS
jgi:hypothetical protein